MKILSRLNPSIGTIGEILGWGVEQLKKYNIPNPNLDAQVLLAHVLNSTRENILVNMTCSLKLTEITKYSSFIKRRCKFEPVAYLTQEKEFYGLKFYVNSNVLIPRPETELLVEEIISKAQELRKPITMLDIGTGTGCIAISVAKNINKIHIIASDISKKAIHITDKNALYHRVEHKLLFCQGNILKGLKIAKECGHPLSQFDIIASNPPYIPHKEISKLQKDIVDYEPKKALDGGKDGLKYIRKIIRWAPEYLKENGYLILEIGYNQGIQVKDLLINESRYNPKSVIIKKDYANLDRIAIAQKG